MVAASPSACGTHRSHLGWHHQLIRTQHRCRRATCRNGNSISYGALCCEQPQIHSRLGRSMSPQDCNRRAKKKRNSRRSNIGKLARRRFCCIACDVVSVCPCPCKSCRTAIVRRQALRMIWLIWRPNHPQRNFAFSRSSMRFSEHIWQKTNVKWRLSCLMQRQNLQILGLIQIQIWRLIFPLRRRRRRRRRPPP